ncbi:ORF6N domain-containing protein [Pedobacter frigoris]|uniref:ORF6N domain-containing protein n=1 Tax=Pedobacter frigoris TaxID=2571272 RepID=UPI00292DC0EC|nr:ORF6N domain-containing protein [Pedobacter frigoris]
MREIQLAFEAEGIKTEIMTFRGKRVMIDRDLAKWYDIEIRVLNRAVKRSTERFPVDFMFQLTQEEKQELVTNCDRFASLKHSSSRPYAFTDLGVAMLSFVLRSDTAVKMSINIIEAFFNMRRFLKENPQVCSKLSDLERQQLKIDENFEKVLDALDSCSV